MESEPSDSPGRRDATITLTKANLIAVALLPVFIAVTLLPFGAIWGWEALRSGFHDILRWSVFIPAFIVLVVLHEALHGAGYMRFGRVARSDIRFGVNWRAGAVFAHCAVPLTAQAYRRSAALPGAVLGVVPFLVAVSAGIGWLAYWSFFMLLTAAGDVAILWAVRSVPADALVRDHPTRAGCEIVGRTERPSPAAGG